jgi:hypothetical protein
MDEHVMHLMFAVPMPKTPDDAARLMRFLLPPCWTVTATAGGVTAVHDNDNDCCDALIGDVFELTIEGVVGYVRERGAEYLFYGNVDLIGLGVRFVDPPTAPRENRANAQA